MSIAEALFSPAQARVLARVFGEPDRWYHVKELMRLTGLGSASLQRELRRLESAALVDVRHVGNQKQLRANPASPVFIELCAVVRKTVGVLATIGQALEGFVDGIALACVYGSVAQGTEHAGSDIDLLIVSDRYQTADLMPALLEAEAVLGRRINPNVYEVAEFDRLRADRNSFVSKVTDRGVEVLVGSIQ